jgi:hypothetical protein
MEPSEHDEAQVEKELDEALAVTPGRQTFPNEVISRSREFCDRMTNPNDPEHIPELQGVALIFIWDDSIPSQDLAFGTVLGRNMSEPLVKLHGLLQATRMTRWFTEQVGMTLAEGDEALSKLNKEIQNRRSELELIEQSIEDKKSAGPPRGEAGAGGPPAAT